MRDKTLHSYISTFMHDAVHSTFMHDAEELVAVLS